MTKEDLAFIRALREQGVDVTFSQPPQMQGGFIENTAPASTTAVNIPPIDVENIIAQDAVMRQRAANNADAQRLIQSGVIKQYAQSDPGTIDYPSTDRRSTNYVGNPNWSFAAPNMTGKQRADAESYHGDIIGSELLGLGVEKLASKVYGATKQIIRNKNLSKTLANNLDEATLNPDLIEGVQPKIQQSSGKQLFHGSNNPNLKLDDIFFTEPNPNVGARPGKFASRAAKSGDPLNMPGGFYTNDKPVAGWMGRGDYRYSMDIPAEAKIFNWEGKFSDNISVKELQKLKNQGYDVIKGKNIVGEVEYIPLNKDIISNWTKYKKGESIPTESLASSDNLILDSKKVKEVQDDIAFTQKAKELQSKVPLTRVVDKSNLVVKDGKLFNSVEPYTVMTGEGLTNTTSARNTSHWSYGHVGDPGHGNWKGKSTAIISDYETLSKKGYALDLDPTDTFFYNSKNMELPEGSLILTRDKKLYDDIIKNTNQKNVKYYPNTTNDEFESIVNSYGKREGDKRGIKTFEDYLEKNWKEGKNVAHYKPSSEYKSVGFQGHGKNPAQPELGDFASIREGHPDWNPDLKTVGSPFGGGSSKVHGNTPLFTIERSGNYRLSENMFDLHPNSSEFKDLLTYPKEIQLSELEKYKSLKRRKPGSKSIAELENAMAKNSGFNSYADFKKNVGLPQYQGGGKEVPELQGGEVENKGVPYSPAITEGTNINIYQDQLNRIYPDQKVKVNGKWGPDTEALHRRFKADKAKFKAEAEFRQDFREAMPLTGFGEAVFPGATRVISAFADDIFRKQTGIGEDYPVRTEYDLTKDQNKVAKDLTRQNLSKGTSFISYPQYKTVSPNKAYSNRTGIKTAKALLTDPAFQLQSELGNTSIVITPETFTSEPDTFLIDQYDFNERSYKNLSRDPNMTAGQKLLESFGQALGPYGIARNVAQYFGSNEGDPSSKQYIIQINEDTPELQEGLVEAKVDNTAVNFVNPFLEQELYKQNQAIAAEELRRSKAENPGVIKELMLPSAAEKALNIAANPVQAFGYSVRGEDMPMGLLPNSDNNIDMVLDMVNPFSWANYAVEAGKSAKQGDVLGAGLNLLGAVPGVEIPGVTLGAKTFTSPVVNKVKPVVDDMVDMLTFRQARKNFGNLKFDLENKFLPEKISADNISNKAIQGQSVQGLGYDRFDQTLGGRVSKDNVDNELFRTSARTFGQKYFDPSVIDLLENLSNYGDVSKAVMLGHKLNLADLGQMRRFNTRPLNLTLGGEYTNFLNTQNLSKNFTASDELLADFYTRGYDSFFNSPTNPIRRDYMALALDKKAGVRNPSPRELGLLWQGFDRFHKDARKRLESSILKTKLNEPTSLFRLERDDFPVTVRRNGNTYATKYSDMQVGDILLPDNRFKSSSYDKPAFYGNMGAVINAPAGQSALVPNITGVRNYTNELEAILPSQLELQVKQVSDRLPYFERGQLKNMMLDKSYDFDIVNPYKKGGVEKMKQGGMEQQRFSKEDLAFMRAVREQGVEVTFSGYKNDSPDRNNAANLIPSGNITMENVDKPVFAMDSKGNSTVMQPGQNYKFPGNAVLEVPMGQSGMVENGIPLLQSGISNEQAIYMANNGISQGYQDYTSSNLTNLDKSKAGSGSESGSMEDGTGFGMSDALAIGSGISQISNSLAQLGPESSTEVGSVSGMGGSREQAVEGTIGGTLSSIPIVGQFYQIGSGIGKGFEAGANSLYAEGDRAGGEAMTAMQGIFDPASQFGRNAELWEAGYISDAQAVGGLLGGVIFGGAAGMDRRVREIADRQYKGAMTRATGGMHIAGTPSAESAGKFSRSTGYPKPKRT